MDASPACARGSMLRLPRVDLRLAGDERLATMVANGSDAAFTALFERFQHQLYRYCRSLVGNDADAQDALQTTFTQVLVALREGRRTAPVRPWLYRIAHNEAVSLLRRRRPAEELPVEEMDCTGLSAHEIMEQRARLATLVADLRALPERQRGALVMRELSGLSHEDIAVVLGISVGAAKQTVLEARRSLQKFTEGRTMDCEEVQRIVSDGDGRARRDRRVRAHLRDCEPCGSFTAAIEPRRAALRALSPALPIAAAPGLLARITGTGSGHGGGGAGLTAGTAGKAMGVAVSVKAVATGAAVVVAAAAGAGAIHHLGERPAAAGSAAGSRPAARSASQAVTAAPRVAPAVNDDPAVRSVRSALVHPPARRSERRHHRWAKSDTTASALTSASRSGTGAGHARVDPRGTNGSARTRSHQVASAGGASHRPPAAGAHGSRALSHGATGGHDSQATSSRSSGRSGSRTTGSSHNGTSGRSNASSRAVRQAESTSAGATRRAAAASSIAASPARPPTP
jgi:RNA polymerase sigma factor (sigma-70 family)